MIPLSVVRLWAGKAKGVERILKFQEDPADHEPLLRNVRDVFRYGIFINVLPLVFVDYFASFAWSRVSWALFSILIFSFLVIEITIKYPPALFTVQKASRRAKRGYNWLDKLVINAARFYVAYLASTAISIVYTIAVSCLQSDG